VCDGHIGVANYMGHTKTFEELVLERLRNTSVSVVCNKVW